MSNPSANYQRPSKFLLMMEARTIYEMGTFFMSLPVLCSAPAGDGHPVLVLPGFMASDYSTVLMRKYLDNLGYKSFGWDLGRNWGRDSHAENGSGERIVARLKEIYEQYGQKVSLVGWSLGGIYSRELARMHPEMVRQVITLGSPFNGTLRANNAFSLFEKTSGFTMADVEDGFHKKMHEVPPVPATGIYSKTDGITAWQCCMENESPQSQNVEVYGSHCGLGHNPMALWVIADRLAQSENNWQKYSPSELAKFLYP